MKENQDKSKCFTCKYSLNGMCLSSEVPCNYEPDPMAVVQTSLP